MLRGRGELPNRKPGGLARWLGCAVPAVWARAGLVMVGVGIVVMVVLVAQVDVHVAMSDLLSAGVIATAQPDAIRILAPLPSGQLDVDPILDQARTVDLHRPEHAC